ncbi:hypothetical protein [Brevundimonas sp. Root1423]|uniref:hypothetical protein n=1 Tax=Brevundimonas sp. Root1423 TaxID=1736462 RepID=UPI000A7E2931|nr:hypothetical protein [Brevundimonas sp. Root1423]
MILRAFLPVALAGALFWAGTGAAQELQAGQTMTQSEADRLEAVQSDLDRMEAEEADEARRESSRLEAYRRAVREGRDQPRQVDAEQAEVNREEYEDWSTCLAKLPDQQATMIRQILAQHELSVKSIQDSAAPGANVSAAIDQQRALRDQLIAAIAGESCG